MTSNGPQPQAVDHEAFLRQPVMGCGKHSVLHTAKILRSEDLPMVEIVDSRENSERFLPQLDEMITDGLVTLETVKIE